MEDEELGKVCYGTFQTISEVPEWETLTASQKLGWIDIAKTTPIDKEEND